MVICIYGYVYGELISFFLIFFIEDMYVSVLIVVY